MEQNNGSTPSRKGKHLSWNERILIEGFLKAGLLEPNIANLLGRDRRTIEREVERGQVEHLNSDLTTARVYNADRAQNVHDQNASAKGPAVKLQANRIVRRFVPKGCDIGRYTCASLREIEDWTNNYPRKILNFKTPKNCSLWSWWHEIPTIIKSWAF